MFEQLMLNTCKTSTGSSILTIHILFHSLSIHTINECVGLSVSIHFGEKTAQHRATKFDGDSRQLSVCTSDLDFRFLINFHFVN